MTAPNPADLLRVVKSQSEAFADDTHYAFCLVTTKCLPDVNPTPKLLADAIASGKVGAWALIQVSQGVYILPLDTSLQSPPPSEIWSFLISCHLVSSRVLSSRLVLSRVVSFRPADHLFRTASGSKKTSTKPSNTSPRPSSPPSPGSEL